MLKSSELFLFIVVAVNQLLLLKSQQALDTWEGRRCNTVTNKCAVPLRRKGRGNMKKEELSPTSCTTQNVKSRSRSYSKGIQVLEQNTTFSGRGWGCTPQHVKQELSVMSPKKPNPCVLRNSKVWGEDRAECGPRNLAPLSLSYRLCNWCIP